MTFSAKISFFSLSMLMASALQAQTISSISQTICDSIHKVKCDQEDKCKEIQRSIYNDEMLKYPTLVVDITDLNKPHQYNEFSYKVNRELIRDCNDYIDQFSLLPLSKILDVEGLMNRAQYDSLERKIIEFIALKKTDLLVVCMDDLYPYENASDLASYCFEHLNVGKRYQKGGIVIVKSGAFMLAESSDGQKLPIFTLASSVDSKKAIDFDTIYSVIEKLIAE